MLYTHVPLVLIHTFQLKPMVHHVTQVNFQERRRRKSLLQSLLRQRTRLTSSFPTKTIGITLRKCFYKVLYKMHMRNIAHHIKNLDMSCYDMYGYRNGGYPYFYLLRDEVCVHLRFLWFNQFCFTINYIISS